MPPAVEAQSPSHWTTREFPYLNLIAHFSSPGGNKYYQVLVYLSRDSLCTYKDLPGF